MNKKSMAFWFLIELIAGLAAAFILTQIASDYAKGTIFLKTKIARDLAIEVNTLYAVSGDVYLQYPQNLSDYRVEFDEKTDIVKVYKEIDPLKPSYPYVGEHIDYLKDFKVDFLEFNKENNKIIFEK